MDVVLYCIWATVICSLSIHVVCPSEESCRYTELLNTMNCTNSYLGNIHSDEYPINITSLRVLGLANTDLSSLEANVFRNLIYVWRLDLSNNFLETLKYSLFSSLKDLYFLDLSNNRLTSLTDSRLFSSQKKLSILRLTYNRITFLHDEVLHPLQNLKYLNLSGNQFMCDCQLLPAMIWCKQKNLFTDVNCKSPSELIGYSWKILNKNCNNAATTITSSTSVLNSESDVSTTISTTNLILIITVTCVIMVFLCSSILLYCRWRRIITSAQGENNILVINGNESNLNEYYELPKENTDKIHVSPEDSHHLLGAISDNNYHQLYEEIDYDYVTDGGDMSFKDDTKCPTLNNSNFKTKNTQSGPVAAEMHYLPQDTSDDNSVEVYEEIAEVHYHLPQDTSDDNSVQVHEEIAEVHYHLPQDTSDDHSVQVYEEIGYDEVTYDILSLKGADNIQTLGKNDLGSDKSSQNPMTDKRRIFVTSEISHQFPHMNTNENSLQMCDDRDNKRETFDSDLCARDNVNNSQLHDESNGDSIRHFQYRPTFGTESFPEKLSPQGEDYSNNIPEEFNVENSLYSTT